jgi:hypothetical protein
MSMGQTVAAALKTFLVIWAVAIGSFAWILRDGLGPGAGDSQGWHAVSRFLMTFYWGPVLLALASLYFVIRRRFPSGRETDTSL